MQLNFWARFASTGSTASKNNQVSTNESLWPEKVGSFNEVQVAVTLYDAADARHFYTWLLFVTNNAVSQFERKKNQKTTANFSIKSEKMEELAKFCNETREQ